MVDDLKSGPSSSKLGPPDGVVDPVLGDGDCIGDSLTEDGNGSSGDATLAFSWPVMASDIVRRPNCRDFSAGFDEYNQSGAFNGLDVGEEALSYMSSSLVTVGDVREVNRSFGGGAGLGGVLALTFIELSEGVLRRPFTDRPWYFCEAEGGGAWTESTLPNLECLAIRILWSSV